MTPVALPRQAVEEVVEALDLYQMLFGAELQLIDGDKAKSTQAALASLRAALAEPAQADQAMEILRELVEDCDTLMAWCVKNVHRWNLSQWDRLHTSVAKARALVKEGQAAQPDSVNVAAPAANGGWEQDALRYRWLRSQMQVGAVSTQLPLYRTLHWIGYEPCSDVRDADAAIDAAIAAAPPTAQGEKE